MQPTNQASGERMSRRIALGRAEMKTMNAKKDTVWVGPQTLSSRRQVIPEKSKTLDLSQPPEEMCDDILD